MRKETCIPQRTRHRRRAAGSAFLAVALTIIGLTAAAPANAVVVGVCEMKANNPHPSTHVSGTINSTGTLRCTVGMTEIYLRAYLEKSTGSSWGGNTEAWLNTPPGTTYSSYANTSCSNGPGTFRTRVTYALTSPPGYNPAYSANTIYSPWYSLACGLAGLAEPQALGVGTAGWTSDVPLPEGVSLRPTSDGVELTFSGGK